MPRAARVKSESGTYHIMLRGINHQSIFEDDEDCEKFIQVLDTYRKKVGFEIYAYCLMGNHIHLLLREGVDCQAKFKSGVNIQCKLTRPTFPQFVYICFKQPNHAKMHWDGSLTSPPLLTPTKSSTPDPGRNQTPAGVSFSPQSTTTTATPLRLALATMSFVPLLSSVSL